MSSNATRAPGQGRCLPPFLEANQFPLTGGNLEGRFCSDVLGPTCCLPCPQAEWLYPDHFDAITRSTGWINVVGLVGMVFMLASFVFLPVNKTHRHYLSICLVLAVVLMELGFIIPLGARPEQCFNAITPNDMTTNVPCALSGALVIAGGWAGLMWVFLRAVALHLQICWQLVIGKTFMWGALAAGWGIPAIGLACAMVFSGVSFRFGNTCHINHKHSLADLWIPLLVFSAITVVIQFATFGYCIKVYLASLVDNSSTTGTSDLPSYSNSVRGTLSPRQAYRRVRRVIELQWRGIAIVLVIIADVVFFAVVFVFMDDIQTNLKENPTKAQDWLACLIATKGQKNKCLDLGSSLMVNEATVMSVLVLLSLNGIWLLIFLGRLSMLTGWYDLIKSLIKPTNEFVSVDVRQQKDPNTYEMLSRERDVTKTPEAFATPDMTPVSPTAKSPIPGKGRETPDYFGREARYKSPSRSFSSPKPPQGRSQQPVQSWDSASTYAPPQPPPPGMDPLGMNKF
ncbi:Uncharacterized protein BP5553_07629 [Venustampulla echinocandica]|uniref:G-protein coupled receptors family 2 profile 2 domain-containing protein n=1 Tax=Venustampulla echinocandica TaxID=2656787 RepID=A0A370TH24_9HELO|nr:Uncharacterized protein BP5553_07629 [Venustampulla echinocandica]RDL34501.1 Uncharacterized protein BP5553_07629 [Venustampulla echinocandica]